MPKNLRAFGANSLRRLCLDSVGLVRRNIYYSFTCNGVFAYCKGCAEKPFLALTNAYSGVNLAVFLLKCTLSEAIIVTAIFWVVGYIFYGILCFFPVKKKKKGVEVQTALPVQPVYTQPARPVNQQTPAAKSNIKLDHAVTVTDNLLTKNLSKSDRQELEKLKNTLAVLQIKGTLTPAESDILNENFNALLKLMAKYNA